MWNILGKGPGAGPELGEGAIVRVGFPSCEQRGPWEHLETSPAPADMWFAASLMFGLGASCVPCIPGSGSSWADLEFTHQ